MWPVLQPADAARRRAVSVSPAAPRLLCLLRHQRLRCAAAIAATMPGAQAMTARQAERGGDGQHERRSRSRTARTTPAALLKAATSQAIHQLQHPRPVRVARAGGSHGWRSRAPTG